MTLSIGLQVSKTGDWMGVHDVLTRVSMQSNVFIDRVNKALAEEYVGRVREAIEQDKYRSMYPALSEGWVAVKGHSRFWKDKGDLAERLNVSKVGGGYYLAGFSPTDTNRRGQTLDMIAWILENGSHRVPARPIFEPTAQDFAQDKGTIKAIIDSELEEWLGLG